eukprot:3928479-Prymnesium_polylepis.1
MATGLQLLRSLLDADTALFWTRILVVKGSAKRLRQHPLFVRVQSTLHEMCTKVLERSIEVDVAEELLRRSHQLDGYRTLAAYADALGLRVEPSTAVRVCEDIRVLRTVHDELEHFCEFRCAAVSDRAEFTAELQRVRDLSHVALCDAETEAHWGVLLTKEVRTTAHTAFRLRSSKLFGDEWQQALSVTELGVSVAALVEVCDNASQQFHAKAQRMLHDDELTIVEVGRIFERPQNRNAVETLLSMLPRELELMFPGLVSSPSVSRLRTRLECFSKMVQTLQDASALLGLAHNLGIEEPSEGCHLGELANNVIDLGKNPDQPLKTLVAVTSNFYRELHPFAEQLAAADHLSQPVVVELLRFLRDEVGDNDPRDLADNEEEQAGLGEAVAALIKVHTVLKPLLKTTPTVLQGRSDGALEALGERLHANRMKGDEFSSLLERCTSHLHALRRTYDKMLNKGKESKETIKDVVENGVFVFSPASLKVEFGGEQNVSHLDEMTLRDHRSRALLEMSHKKGMANIPEEASRREQEKLQRRDFLEMTIVSASISESIAELHELGYFEPDVLERRVRGLHNLKALEEQLCQIRKEWRDAISSARTRTYMLSFFCSQQLHQLNQLFRGDSSAGAHLLQYVPAPLQEFTGDPCSAIPNALVDLFTLGTKLQSHFSHAAATRVVPAAWRRRQPAPLVMEGELAVCFLAPSAGRSNMLETLLALFAADCLLPAHSQLLFCRSDTSHDEIDAFLHRAFHANQCELVRGRLFCALRISLLPEASYLYLKQQMMH